MRIVHNIEEVAQQVAQARSAGIDGFIVGWRSTPVLDARLAALRKVAAANNFKLAVTYQAQDFSRKPLPAAQVAHDLHRFADIYGKDPVFQTLGTRPVVAFSGTWLYSEQDIQTITAPLRSRLLMLATEKSAGACARVAKLTPSKYDSVPNTSATASRCTERKVASSRYGPPMAISAPRR